MNRHDGYDRHDRGERARPTHMKELVDYLARSLVDSPDAVRVSEIRSGPNIIVRLKVERDDMGRVIGRQGRIAQAMRILLRVAGQREGRKTILEIG